MSDRIPEERVRWRLALIALAIGGGYWLSFADTPSLAEAGSCCGAPVAAAGGLFPIDRNPVAPPAPPAGCKPAQDRVRELLTKVEAAVPAASKTAVQTFVKERETPGSEADSWDAIATIASLNGERLAAVWAALKAVSLEWRPEHLSNAGVHLAATQRREDALLLLECAYTMGLRSPALLEALANVHRKMGNAAEAKSHIAQARQAAPNDRLIEAESSLINSGRTPPPPRTPPDPLELARRGLLAHMDRSNAVYREMERQNAGVTEALGHSNNMAGFTESMRKSYLASIQSMDKAWESARKPFAEFQKKYPGTTVAQARDLYRMNRNGAFFSYCVMYAGVTRQLLGSVDDLKGAQNSDLSFWAEVMGMDAPAMARFQSDLRNYRFEGSASAVPADEFHAWFGAESTAKMEHARKLRLKEQGDCLRNNPNSPAAEKACQEAVNRRYCETMRALQSRWETGTQQVFQRAARGYDPRAEQVLAWGGVEVRDTYDYLSRNARQIKAKPLADAEVTRQITELNRLYRHLVGMVTSETATEGPAQQVRIVGEHFAQNGKNAEAQIGGYRRSIEQFCSAVDKRELEKHHEELRKAISALLLDQLLRDLNAGWDPNASCSLSMGKHFSVNVDLATGKATSIGGPKWKWAETLFPREGGARADSVDIGAGARLILKNGSEVVGGAVNVGGSGNYGPFSGSGRMSLGSVWNETAGRWDFPVEVSASPSLGWKSKGGFGVSCTPGKFRMKFDARLIANEAMTYVQSLK